MGVSEMRGASLWLAILAAPSLLGGPTLAPDTLTLSAYRVLNSSLEQIYLSVTVYATPDQSFEEVIAMLAGSGLGAADFSSVYTSEPLGNTPQTYWSFFATRPIGKLTESLSALAKLSGRFPANVTFSINVWPGLPPSPPCDYSSLVTSARAQAQKIAEAAGAAIGPVIALSDGTWSMADAGAPVIGGYFSSPGTGPAGSGLIYATASSGSCSMTVQFKLLH